MDLRELNYILIPGDNERWEAWARSRWGRRLVWLATPLLSLTREGQALLVATLVTGAAGIDVGGSHLYLVFCGLAGLLLAAALVRPFARLDGVELSVERPPRVEAGQPLTLTAVLRNTGSKTRYGVRIHGPYLPWDGLWVGRTGAVPVLAPGAELRVALRLRFLKRGERYIGRLWASSVHPLGLVGGRAVFSAPVRVTVVPPIRAVSRLSPRPRGGGDGHGPRAAIGDADALIGVRPYRPGDRIRDLHPRSWARLGEPMIREYARPQQPVQQVICCLALPTVDRDSVDGAVTAAASLTADGIRAGARVELSVDAGAAPHRLAVGQRAAGLELALDLLASAAARAPAVPGPLVGSARTPLTVVFAGWGPELAGWWAAARLARPGAVGLVIHRRAAVRAAAEAAGLRALDPRSLSEGLRL